VTIVNLSPPIVAQEGFPRRLASSLLHRSADPRLFFPLSSQRSIPYFK
jgi:hypothetical protein